jgi:hypothetical protein
MRARLRLALERHHDDVTGALKEGVKGLEHELGFFVGGGKGGRFATVQANTG